MPPDPPPGGVRRRHSAPNEDEPERSSPLLVNPSTLPSSPTSSSISVHHVRFSTDVDRRPSRTDLGISNIAATMSPSARPSGLNLTLDTKTAASSTVRPLVSSPSPAHTPSPLRSPSPDAVMALPKFSPQSPKTRNRGYSLRRTIFNKNMVDPADGVVSPIELESVGSSSVHASTAAADTATMGFGQDGSKKGDTLVTVSTVFDDPAEAPKLSFSDRRKKPGLQGISALPNYETWIRQRADQTRAIRRIKTLYRKTRNTLLRIVEIPPSKDGRHIDVDATRKAPLLDERIMRPYVSNIIRSSRYNVFNFLPRQIFAQFSKLANFYFLIVSVLQMIPGLSTTGTYTTIIPLLFFVSISMAKEGYDDFRRYRLDKEENNRETSVLHAYKPMGSTDGVSALPNAGLIHWATTKWRNVQVGDIIKLERDQAAPADLILLHSNGENGVAYIETMALDGETNLKSKQATPSLSRTCDTLEKIATSTAHIVVEDPNIDLYNFEGRVHADGETSPLSNTEVIYRGSILRNTPEAIGIVIYSGEECKIRMNANQNPRIKAPTLQAAVNKIIFIIVVFVIALAVFNTVAYQIWANAHEHNAWYLHRASVDFGPILVSFIIMFNTMIPLSLYVSMEIIKLGQMFLLNDIDMYDQVSDTPLEARTSTINEELGQISYIFSDKTGTLTDNSMKFRKLSVAGTAWLHDSDLKRPITTSTAFHNFSFGKKSKGKKPARRSRLSESDDAPHAPRPSGLSTHQHSPISESPGKWKSSARPTKAQPELLTVEMLNYIQRKPYTVFARKARFMLLSLALCHTCLPETQEDGKITFQAASPDELALVQAAQEMGYLVADRHSGTVMIKTYPNGVDGEPLIDHYTVLDVIEFSSKRKRMSVVVRFPDQRICVISKGADSILVQLLRLSTLAMQKTVEIEKRASRRKSIEAQQAIARKSEQIDVRASISRASINLGRASIGGLVRTSVSMPRLHSLRDQVDTWLTERERDVDAPELNDNDAYSPRPSAQIRRGSVISNSTSGEQDDDIGELVEEALAVDEPAIIERCFQHINDFATEGLRTLLYGYRFVDEEEYRGWKKVYSDATTSLVDRQARIEKAGELIERDLELAGATAIEDKLQRGVPETIDKLRRANIKLWMLTGDKRETAINIGHSCRLIKDYSAVTVLDHETGQVEQHIAAAVVAINRGGVAHSVVVVDGQTLAMIEASPPLHSLFLDLAILVDSVICCRASPSQKAGLVKAIRRKVKHSITLAIGDGANDIAMIQEAHVGIGITGKEGLQAARTSDYSIAQFRFLSKLLLVHGRWNYARCAKYTVATFWKEMAFFLAQAFYQRYTGFTGTSLYYSTSLTVFNTLFSSLCVILPGIFEKDLEASTLLAVPELYASHGPKSAAFNLRVYLWWMFLACSESALIFYVTYALLGVGSQLRRGNDLFPFGNLIFTAFVVFINTKLLLVECHTITRINCIAWFVTVGGWFCWNLLLAGISKDANGYFVKHSFLHRFGPSPGWWAVLTLVFVSCCVLELALRTGKHAVRPSDTAVYQALQCDELIRARFETASQLECEGSRGVLDRGAVAEGEVEAKTGGSIAETDAERREREREEEVAELLRRRAGV